MSFKTHALTTYSGLKHLHAHTLTRMQANIHPHTKRKNIHKHKKENSTYTQKKRIQKLRVGSLLKCRERERRKLSLAHKKSRSHTHTYIISSL